MYISDEKLKVNKNFDFETELKCVKAYNKFLKKM